MSSSSGEETEYYHAENPAAIKSAEVENSKRFLSLDLNYGHRVDSEMYEYLTDNGMTREEYHFFLGNSLHHLAELAAPTSRAWTPGGSI